MKYLNDTIVASSSAMVNQAISIIRISGTDAYQTINKIFSANILQQNGNTLKKGYIIDLQKMPVDEVVLSCFRAPKSFTGEDVIEITCHGGILVTQKILKLILSLGVRLAEPGEFSKRAFLNNKINLIQAEAINDLIFAENETSLKSAINNLSSNATNLIQELSDELLTLIAQINVNIDYPEYDGVIDVTNETANNEITKFYEKIKTIKEHSQIAKQIKTGINTAIIGRPNVGKSSLLNALLQEERAIVSDIKGTTRDLVEGKINLGSISLNLIDTAGIRSTNNQIEKIGIDRAKQAIKQSQLIILVLDGSKRLTKDDQTLIDLISNKNHIIAINKNDLNLKMKIPNSITISAKNNHIESLISVIKQKIMTVDINFNQELILANTRQLACLDEIEQQIIIAIKEIKNEIPIDLVIVYLQKAWNILLEIRGIGGKVNLIDEIFQRFCLGK